MTGASAWGAVKPPGDGSGAANGHRTGPTASGPRTDLHMHFRQGPTSDPDKRAFNKGLQRQEAGTGNPAAQGSPVMGGVELWGVIVVAAARAPPSLILSSEASGGAAPPPHPTGGARGLLSELGRRAAPKTPSVKITTKTCWAQTDDICLCGQ